MSSTRAQADRTCSMRVKRQVKLDLRVSTFRGVIKVDQKDLLIVMYSDTWVYMASQCSQGDTWLCMDIYGSRW